jgi:hypothetical protein
VVDLSVVHISAHQVVKLPVREEGDEGSPFTSSCVIIIITSIVFAAIGKTVQSFEVVEAVKATPVTPTRSIGPRDRGVARCSGISAEGSLGGATTILVTIGPVQTIA